MSNLDNINAESVPIQDFPQVSTYVDENVNDVISILSQDEASNVDGLQLRLNAAKIKELKEEKDHKTKELDLARLRGGGGTPQEMDKRVKR